MINQTKLGRADGAGEYHLRGVMTDGERYTGKMGLWHGPAMMMERLGMKPGQEIDEQTYRCLLRGLDPAKAKVAFHEIGGAFNHSGLLGAVWSDADKNQRKSIVAILTKAGASIRQLPYTSAAGKVVAAFEKSVGALKGAALEKLQKAVFKAAAKVPGYTLTENAGQGRQTGYDLTGTLPKDISVLWARAIPEQRLVIEGVIRDAANGVIDYLNKYAGVTRAGKGGEEQVKGQMMAAVFLDFVARPVDMRGNELPEENEFVKLQDVLGSGVDGVFVDPHLHAHIVVPNSVLCEDGKWRALDGPRLYQAQAAAGQIWHAGVVRGLQEKLGIEFANEKENGLVEIPAIPREAVQECSKRTQIIDLEKDARGLADVPNKEIGRALWDTIKLSTRAEHITLDNDVLDAHMHGRLDSVGYNQATSGKIFADGQERIAAGVATQALTEDQVMAEVEALLENESVFSDHKLRARLLGKYLHVSTEAEILKAVDYVLETHLIDLGEFDKRQTYTSPEMLALEANYLDIAKVGKHESAITRQDIAKSLRAIQQLKRAEGKPMSKEQAQAARHLLEGDSLVSVLVGPAGAGKTYTLETVQHCLKAAGYTILGCALSWSASEQLKAEGKLDKAAAVAKLCYDIKHGKAQLDNRTCIVLDEGSLVSSREMGTLLIAAHEAGAKIIITGDTEQIQAVGAGAAMRAIAERCGAFELATVRRQSKEWDRLAGLDIRAGGDRLKTGIEAHVEHGRLHVESSNEEAIKALFENWQSYRTANPESSQLMISRKNSDCDELNRLARESLHAAGQLGDDHTIRIAIGKDKKDLDFATGDFIQFRLKSKAAEIHNGDEIIEGQVFNRTRATIKEITADKRGVSSITVELWSGDQKTGKTMTLKPSDFRNGDFSMEHAYAVTPGSSQGMTVDRSLVMPGGMDQQRAYVSLSRHRHEMKMFVSRDDMHTQVARYMEHTAFTDRNDFTDQMAKESLIAGLQRKSGKMTTLDYISDKSRFADMSCLKGTRYEILVRTDQALMKTWQLLDASKKVSAASTVSADVLRKSTNSVTEKIRENGLTGKFLRPSIIHSPDNSQQMEVRNHRDQEALKTSLLDAAKAWGTRIYITGRKSFHAACIKVSKELGIKFGSTESVAYLKENANEHRNRFERSRRAAREVAEQFGFGIDLSGSTAFAADAGRVARDKELRMQMLPARDVAVSQSGQGLAQADGVLRRDAPEHVRGRRSGRNGGSEPVRETGASTGGVASRQGKRQGASVKIAEQAHDVPYQPVTEEASEPKRKESRPSPSMKPRGMGDEGQGM